MKITYLRLGVLVLLLGTATILLVGDSSVWSAQVPLPTSPTAANPGDCCQDQAATCGNLGSINSCFDSTVKCDQIDCLSEKVKIRNPWGTCDLLTSNPNAKCQSF